MNESTKGLAHERAAKLLEETRGVASQFGVSSRDREFLQSLVERQQRVATPKVDKWLRDLEHKVFVKGIAE